MAQKKTTKKGAGSATKKRVVTKSSKRKGDSLSAKRTARKSSPKKAASARESSAARAASGIKTTYINNSMETAMTQGKVNFDKLAKEASNASRENLDVFMTSGNIFIKGYEGVVQTWASWAQDSAEKNSKAIKTLLGCKDLNELTDVNNKLAQQNFDGWVSSSTKISEQYAKVLTDALEPINDQLGKAIKKAGDAVSA